MSGDLMRALGEQPESRRERRAGDKPRRYPTRPPHLELADSAFSFKLREDMTYVQRSEEIARQAFADRLVAELIAQAEANLLRLLDEMWPG